jgi:hypothetical protein
MPVWEVDEPTLNLRVTDTPLIYQPKFGPTLELTLTFNSRRRDAPAGKFLPQGRFEVGPAAARYMLASSWMSWVEYDSDSELAPAASVSVGYKNGLKTQDMMNDENNNEKVKKYRSVCFFWLLNFLFKKDSLRISHIKTKAHVFYFSFEGI